MARCTLTLLVCSSAAARARLPVRMNARKISSFLRVNSSSISMAVGSCSNAVDCARKTLSRPRNVISACTLMRKVGRLAASHDGYRRSENDVPRGTIQRLEPFARCCRGVHWRRVDVGGGKPRRQPLEDRQRGDLWLYLDGAVQRFHRVPQRARAAERNHAEGRSLFDLPADRRQLHAVLPGDPERAVGLDAGSASCGAGGDWHPAGDQAALRGAHPVDRDLRGDGVDRAGGGQAAARRAGHGGVYLVGVGRGAVYRRDYLLCPGGPPAPLPWYLAFVCDWRSLLHFVAIMHYVL
ncbi:hypothetical protein Ddc_23498 [Ditylenchus destructor]|nr:hypothetical protein Ddc_23498 [Ditylenchus destructor]